MGEAKRCSFMMKTILVIITMRLQASLSLENLHGLSMNTKTTKVLPSACGLMTLAAPILVLGMFGRLVWTTISSLVPGRDAFLRKSLSTSPNKCVLCNTHEQLENKYNF